MHVYKLYRTDVCDYDEFDAHVIVAAEPLTKEQAINLVQKEMERDDIWYANNPEVELEEINCEACLVLSSFNAG